MSLRVTDPPPTDAKEAGWFEASARLKTLPLPKAGFCDADVHRYVAAHAIADVRGMERALNQLAKRLAKLHRIYSPTIRLRGVRPHRREGGLLSYQQLGECKLTGTLTIWTKTAHKKQIASVRAILNTFAHEYCHYLDFWHFRFITSPHTVGFYERAARLYHRLLRERVRPLIWIPTLNGRWIMQFSKPGRRLAQKIGR